MPPSWRLGEHRGPTGRSALSIVGLRLRQRHPAGDAPAALPGGGGWSAAPPSSGGRGAGWTGRRWLALLPVPAILLRRTLPLEVAALLDWVAYSWLGIAFYAFLALLASN